MAEAGQATVYQGGFYMDLHRMLGVQSGSEVLPFPIAPPPPPPRPPALFLTGFRKLGFVKPLKIFEFLILLGKFDRLLGFGF